MKALKREGGKSLCGMAVPEGVSVRNGLALGESLCGMVWPWGGLCVEWPSPRKSGDAHPLLLSDHLQAEHLPLSRCC